MQDTSGGGGARDAFGRNEQTDTIRSRFVGLTRGGVLGSLLDEVRPGDLITSDFMRRLLTGLARLEVEITDLGRVQVPELFGKDLEEAEAELTRNKLKVGKVLDAFGRHVSQNPIERFVERKVLSQSPPAGSRTDEGESVNLLVSVQLFSIAGRLFEEFRKQGVFDLAGVAAKQFLTRRTQDTDTQRPGSTDTSKQDAPATGQPVPAGGQGDLVEGDPDVEPQAAPASTSEAATTRAPAAASARSATAAKPRRAARKSRGGKDA